MKVRLNLYPVMHSLPTGKEQTAIFDLVCTIAGVHDSKKVLDALRSGDFEIVARSD